MASPLASVRERSGGPARLTGGRGGRGLLLLFSVSVWHASRRHDPVGGGVVGRVSEGGVVGVGCSTTTATRSPVVLSVERVCVCVCVSSATTASYCRTIIITRRFVSRGTADNAGLTKISNNK